jgi:hypothetical protein
MEKFEEIYLSVAENKLHQEAIARISQLFVSNEKCTTSWKELKKSLIKRV